MRILSFLLLVSAVKTLSAQSDLVYIDTIAVEGNKKTKTDIILRELSFRDGDSIPQHTLQMLLRENEQLVMNTSLFNKVTISAEPAGEYPMDKVRARVQVEEAWYIYPVPVFELADRNFNVWWVEQDRSLQRVNFGLEFTHTNVSGHMDRLKIGAKYGYTHNYSTRYTLPYINKKQTVGLSAGVSYSQNREINYATENNKQAFYRDRDNFIYTLFRTEVGLSYRPGLRVFHHFNLSYNQNRIADVVAQELNPDFFLHGKTLQRYVSLNYQFIFDSRDVRPYPLYGKYFVAWIRRDGFDFFNDRNALTLLADYNQYFPIGARWNASLRTGGKVSFIREQQPYNDNRGLGFGRNYLHGYEYYIVDGLDVAYVKTSLRYSLLRQELDFGRLMPIRQFRVMPIKLFFSLNGDFGYVNDPFVRRDLNPMSNRPLWGGGPGLDFIFFYDKVLRIEYSFNHLRERGLFLHVNLNI